MTFDPNDGEVLPDGSTIGTTTAGELADWLAANPPAPVEGLFDGCTCEDPQPYNLCCPSKLVYPVHTKWRRRQGE
jgi:hypothetical protein